MDEKNRMDFTGINRTFLSVCLQLYSLQEVYFIIYSLSINRILYINTLQIYKMFFKQPQFRSIILCDLLLYIEVTFWDLSIDLGIFWGSWFLHRHKIPHPNPMGDMIATKKYCLFKEYFRVVCFICI